MDMELHKLEQAAELLRTISHPARLCIIKKLLDDEPCNVTYLQHCMSLPQSTLSTHLQKLRSANIVTATRQGLEVFYSINNEKVRHIVPILLSYESVSKS